MVSNENEIGIERLFNREIGLEYVQRTRIKTKGSDEDAL